MVPTKLVLDYSGLFLSQRKEHASDKLIYFYVTKDWETATYKKNIDIITSEILKARNKDIQFGQF